MRLRLTLLALCVGALIRAQAPVLPDTPAGRQFGRWLELFNRGEREPLAEFLKQNFARQRPIQGQMDFREMTGGFDLKKIEASRPVSLSGIVQERESGQYARFEMVVEAAAPHKVTQLGLNVVPRPAGLPALPRLSEAQALEALRAQLDKAAAADQFAGAILVAKDGRILLSEARGLADREKKIPNRLETRFRIGSMNKMFTGVAVAQLAQAGKLKFTDPIGKYLTDYPNRDVASKVTVHHLLTHTGGTGDIFGPEFNQKRQELRELKDYVALYGRRGLKFEPGSQWEYSNYGFLLAGVLVEKVSGQSYYDYVRERIFRPAGMTRTDSLPEAEKVDDRAVGYTGRVGARKPNWDSLPVRGTSAGGGYSTVLDLHRFATALLSHKLLNPEYTRTVISGKVEARAGGKYAYGFADQEGDGARVAGHGGGAPGMNGDLKIFLQSGYVIAALSNLDPPAAGRMSDFVAQRLPR